MRGEGGKQTNKNKSRKENSSCGFVAVNKLLEFVGDMISSPSFFFFIMSFLFCYYFRFFSWSAFNMMNNSFSTSYRSA